MEGIMHKVVIIGGGCAGYTAGIYTGRARLEPIIFAGYQAGGQLMMTGEVENFPGFPAGIAGPELMQRMQKQAEKFGAKIIMKDVDEVDFKSSPFRVRVGSEWYETGAVIVATGARAKLLGVPGEKEFMGRGVSTCATCDGAFFRDQKVAVIGGGDTAMEEALYLSRLASEVVVIHRRDELRASKIMQERAFENPKISFIWNTVVKEVLGDPQKGVTGLKLFNRKTEAEEILEINGVFVAIGHEPSTKIFEGQLELDHAGYILTEGYVKTSVPGVYAAGDCVDYIYRQAVTASAMGCMAAIEVERYLSTHTR